MKLIHTDFYIEHLLEFNHEFDLENTKIVHYVYDYRKRLKSEMIHIKFVTSNNAQMYIKVN